RLHELQEKDDDGDRKERKRDGRDANVGEKRTCGAGCLEGSLRRRTRFGHKCCRASAVPASSSCNSRFMHSVRCVSQEKDVSGGLGPPSGVKGGCHNPGRVGSGAVRGNSKRDAGFKSRSCARNAVCGELAG